MARKNKQQQTAPATSVSIITRMVLDQQEAMGLRNNITMPFNAMAEVNDKVKDMAESAILGLYTNDDLSFGSATFVADVQFNNDARIEQAWEVKEYLDAVVLLSTARDVVNMPKLDVAKHLPFFTGKTAILAFEEGAVDETPMVEASNENTNQTKEESNMTQQNQPAQQPVNVLSNEEKQSQLLAYLASLSPEQASQVFDVMTAQSEANEATAEPAVAPERKCECGNVITKEKARACGVCIQAKVDAVKEKNAGKTQPAQPAPAQTAAPATKEEVNPYIAKATEKMLTFNKSDLIAGLASQLATADEKGKQEISALIRELAKDDAKWDSLKGYVQKTKGWATTAQGKVADTLYLTSEYIEKGVSGAFNFTGDALIKMGQTLKDAAPKAGQVAAAPTNFLGDVVSGKKKGQSSITPKANPTPEVK